MQDRVKAYLVIVSAIFIVVYFTSEYLAKHIDKEVELYNHHVALIFNSHEIVYHFTSIQADIYRLAYGAFENTESLRLNIKPLEQGIDNISKGISYIFIAGRDDEAFRGYANNAEAIQQLYPLYKSHLQGVLAETDARERVRQLEAAIETGERMEFFIDEIDKRLDEEYGSVSSFLPTITVDMRRVRNITGILFWGVIVLLSLRYFYSCKTCSRLMPFLGSMKKGDYETKHKLQDTLCENEVQSAFQAVVKRIRDVEKSSSELSIIDSLTGAYNRRYFDLRISEEMSRYTRHGTIYSLFIIDIDYFKKINDTLGHQVGDSVLKELVTVIKKCVRDTDIVTRYGGEEFAIISPYTPKSGVLAQVERLRMTVGGHNFAGLGKPLTISIGVADCAGKSTAEQIIKEADASLYIAKNSGRNMCVIGGLTAQQSA